MEGWNMTNADKYLKDGVDVEEFIRDITDNIGIAIPNLDTERKVSLGFYAHELNKWFETPVKPTLTEDEKVILRNIDDTKHNDLVIKRCKNENLIIYNGGNWAWQIDIFNHLFQFIQPRRRI